ncbi:beta-ketoacyl synthase N-terminal-like domain-containing protein [Photobacterium sp. DNB22_13_2]
MPVYLRQGQQRLPKDMGWDVFFSQAPLPVTAIDNTSSLGLASKAGYLSDTDLKQVGVSRIVRKTSEKQSRWVIENSVNSWRMLLGEQLADEKTGLFLGLGTVDCDDDGEQISFQGDYAELAREGLSQIKPLSGLTLLNSTTASHIAELLQITGVNGVYSPHADAGGNAIVEAYYNLSENQCEIALVSGGSPKITPWYFLAYQSILKGFSGQYWFPTEAVATALLSKNSQSSEGCLLCVQRGFSADFQVNNHSLDHISLHLSQSQDALLFESPLQVIHVGLPEIAQKTISSFNRFFPGSHHLLLDKLIGTSGPASAIVGVNLALEIFKRQVMLSNDKSQLKTFSCESTNCRHVLVACYGLQGQQVYFLVGDAAVGKVLGGEKEGSKHD